MAAGFVSWISIALTILLGAVLETMPLPDLVTSVRPQWTTLFVIYWLLRHPEKVGIFFAAGVGFLMDLITGSYFGVHMLAIGLLAYFVLVLHLRLKMFPILQQACVIFFLIGIELMLINLLRALLSGLDNDMDYLWQALSSALVWPLVLLLIDRIQILLR
jgi:rod shape-determining protein MreD